MFDSRRVRGRILAPALLGLGLLAAAPRARRPEPPRSRRSRACPRATSSSSAAPTGPPGPSGRSTTGSVVGPRSSTGFQSVIGPLPGAREAVPARPRRSRSEVDCGTYVRRSITYASEPGSRVPAYLLIPKAALAGGARRVPAALCLHRTDNVVGHGVVVGLGGRPNRAYAAELAERGYVTLAPNYPLLAKYQPDLKALGWESGTLKAVWDNIRGLDLLESLPFVDPGGFGAIGHSLGGHNSVFTAVFDDRIKAVVSSCGLDSFLDYYGGADEGLEAREGLDPDPLHAPAGRLPGPARRRSRSTSTS